MKIYSFGEETKPAILLLPGTCCHWKRNFGHVIPLLQEHFYVLCASYDGFDETEDSTFPNMLIETAKLENYIQKNLGGQLFAAYGCSLGGSFVGLMVQRKKIHIRHGILGSSDLDQGSNDYLTKEGEVIRNVNGNQTCHANCTGRGKKGVDEMYLRIISHRYWQHK